MGFNAEDLILTTFGHIVWTKWGDRLLEAFLSSSLRSDSRVHLVFAGDIVKDDFGRQLEKSIKNSGLSKRIRITGYLSKRDFTNYLAMATVAIQLRTMSRGGTPKGVLDCLAFGVPVVLNNDASYTDYPDGVVVKLPADPSTSDIATALEEICSNELARTKLAQAGRDYVRANHDPVKCAATYAAAIHEFNERHRRSKPEPLAKALAPHLARCDEIAAASQAAADWLQSMPMPSFERRRLFVDVSHIAQFDFKTGVQRVVKEIVRALYCSPRPGVEAIAVELIDGDLRIARSWLQGRGLLLPQEIEREEFITFRPGDAILMLDSSWGRYREFSPAFNKARKAQARIYTGIHDLLPIVMPSGNFGDGTREWFEDWFRAAIQASDGLVCTTRTGADAVIAYLKNLPDLQRVPSVGFWHLGSDFSPDPGTDNPSREVSELKSRPYLMMLGTIEPRKSHALALDAMERLWKGDHDLCLCIAGREGWMVSDLMDRLRGHPMRGTKLFVFDAPSDQDVSFLYGHAVGLLYLSKGEGFGLPLLEAADHGIPIICSDIPVFHEIAGDFATYVVNRDPAFVAKAIATWWEAKKAAKLPDIRLMPRLTWEQSSLALLNVVFDNSWVQGAK